MLSLASPPSQPLVSRIPDQKNRAAGQSLEGTISAFASPRLPEPTENLLGQHYVRCS